MPQISLYIDSPTLAKVEKAAKMEHLSISKWVKQKILGGLHRAWPENYFKLYGSLKDPSFKRHPGPDFESDIPRERL